MTQPNDCRVAAGLAMWPAMAVGAFAFVYPDHEIDALVIGAAVWIGTWLSIWARQKRKAQEREREEQRRYEEERRRRDENGVEIHIRE